MLPSTICAPSARTSSGSTPLTVAFPTGMKAGVPRRRARCGGRRRPASPVRGDRHPAAPASRRDRDAVGRSDLEDMRAAARDSQHEHRIAERVEAVPLLDREPVERGASPPPRRTPSRARAASSAAGGSSSAGVDAAELEPGRDEQPVRPESGPPCATVSSTRTVVVPTASTRSAASIRSHAAGADLVALAVQLVVLEDSASSGRNVSRPTCSVTRSTSSRARSSGVKCSPRSAPRPSPSSRVNRLVALGSASGS